MSVCRDRNSPWRGNVKESSHKSVFKCRLRGVNEEEHDRCMLEVQVIKKSPLLTCEQLVEIITCGNTLSHTHRHAHTRVIYEGLKNNWKWGTEPCTTGPWGWFCGCSGRYRVASITLSDGEYGRRDEGVCVCVCSECVCTKGERWMYNMGFHTSVLVCVYLNIKYLRQMYSVWFSNF